MFFFICRCCISPLPLDILTSDLYPMSFAYLHHKPEKLSTFTLDIILYI